MKVKINEYGNLELERKGKFIKQECLYSRDNVNYCGDVCPFFGEPFTTLKDIFHPEMGEEVRLEICNNRVFFLDKQDFNDERNYEKETNF